ncbi:MAG TPA: glycosyltransferase family 39 protein [Candidatus Binataceae bacterium]|nr:glycosyltransferase family 39 protein [Candidatus Binataceae bacterium]
MKRKSSRDARSKAPPELHARIGFALALVLIAPRIIRLLYPEIWVEDDFYLESAYLVASGMRPYLDFVHPHLPMLEWIAGGYLKIFGASHYRIELLNEAAIYITSVMVFALGARAGGRRAGIAASILYAFSSLVFRYHVYERECFVAPIVVGATVMILDGAASGRFWRAMVVAGLLALACSIKLTAVIPAAVILLFVAAAERRIIRAIEIGAAIAAAVALLCAFCYWRYGYDFVFQTFIFHFMKGREIGGTAATLYPAQILDILAPLAILGAVRLAITRKVNRATALVLYLAGAEYLFFGVLSPTAWGHNYLEALPFIASVAGLGATRLARAIRDLVTAERHDPADWRWLIGGGALVIVGLAWLTPLVNENWLRGSVYGFGYVPRAEVAELAAAIDRASAPGDEIIAPSFLCFEANRIELIRFPETYGVYREARAEFAKGGFLAARRKLGSADFFGLIAATSHYWTAGIHDAIAAHRVPVVISDSPVQLLPLVDVPPDFLASSGYRPVLRTEHFTVWLIVKHVPGSGR